MLCIQEDNGSGIVKYRELEGKAWLTPVKKSIMGHLLMMTETSTNTKGNWGVLSPLHHLD
jgi:hypothetical protein